MADPVIAAAEPTPAPAAAAPALATPAVAAPVAAAPAPEAASRETPAAPAEVAAPESASLLSEARPAPEAPSKDATPEKPVEEVKAPDASASAEASPPVAYEPWKLPEGVSLTEADVQPFNDILAATKAPQEVGQQLIDLHLAEVTKVAERMAARQTEHWNETRRTWVDQVRADPEIGGNRLETVLNAAGAVIEQYGGTADQVKELRQVLALTGAGDHPALVRLFNNLGKARATEGRPVAAMTPPPAPQTRAQRRYAGSLNGAASQ